MNYIKLPFKNFLYDLSAKKPIPGGGAASILVSVTGIGCLLKVINYTLGKKGYEKYEQKLKRILIKLKKCEKQLLECIELEINFFSKVSEAYKIPKVTENQRKIRSRKIKKFLGKLNSVGQKIIKLNSEVIGVVKDLVDIGNKNLITDIGCGVLFINSGAKSTLLNLLVNNKTLKMNKRKVDKNISLVKKINQVSQKMLDKINRVIR